MATIVAVPSADKPTPPAPPPQLPAASSPTLALVPATAAQKLECWALNGASWRGPLTQEAYVRREQHLGAQELMRDGGATYWVLVDTAATDKEDQPVILAACESYRKPALVARRRPGDGDGGAGEVRGIVSHGIGSVYCRELFRGRGYAGRMMDELRKKLETWQQREGESAVFNVLYSGIGDRFYAKRGWLPYTSSYVSLPAKAGSGDVGRLPTTRPIHTQDLQSLCEADAELMKRRMADFSNSKAKVRVAFVPDANAMRWMHAREEFYAEELGKSSVDVKGAVLGDTVGQRVWSVWTRQFSSDPKTGVLSISRIVDESKPTAPAAESHQEPQTPSSDSVEKIAACLQAAQQEAAGSGLAHVHVWNPSSETLAAAKKLFPEAELAHFEKDPICSLLWYGSDVVSEDLEWVGNERYAWC